MFLVSVELLGQLITFHPGVRRAGEEAKHLLHVPGPVSGEQVNRPVCSFFS